MASQTKNEIRVALVGVGNCASTLVQGVTHYRQNPDDTTGLMHPTLAGLKVSDIHFACAFDVDARKINQPLKEAIFAKPNNARIFSRNPQDDGAMVYQGPQADGVAAHLQNFDEAKRTAVGGANNTTQADIVRILKQTNANILVNYLPVGSQKATELYASACLEANVALVNAIPVFIASDPVWAEKFRAAQIPIIGDDVKSQFGATITHRVLMKLAEQRGMTTDTSYQLNVGGNTDFLNMLERARLTSKKTSKTEAVTSQVPMDEKNIHIGPSDYIPFLADNKVCYIRMNMRGFAGLPMELDMKLSVEDSPDSAGIVVDAIRCLHVAQQNRIAGPLLPISAALMKRPPTQMQDEAAATAMDQWISSHTR